MPSAALPLALASTAPDALSAQNPTFAYAVWGVVLGGIVSAVMVADRIDSMLERRRRKPSVDVDLVGLQASIVTLNKTVEKIEKAQAEHNGHKERLAALEKKTEELDKEAAETAAAQRRHLQKLTQEIFQRIEGVESTLASNFKELERGLGRVEGQLTQLNASKG